MQVQISIDNNPYIYNLEAFGKDVVSFGRDAECDIQIKKNYVSRNHGCFFRENGRWFIQDLNSTNGIYLKAKRIQQLELVRDSVILVNQNDPGDVVRITPLAQVVQGVIDRNYQVDETIQLQELATSEPVYPGYKGAQGFFDISEPETGVSGEVYESEHNLVQGTNDPGMKWFNFIIWIQLFLTALLGLINGIRLISGGVYGKNASAVYNTFGGLKVLDVIVGILFLLIAVAAVFVRFQLAGFKMNAPRLYLILLITIVSVTLVYYVIAGIILTKDSRLSFSDILEPSTVVSMATSLVLVFVNMVYFEKRKHLFIN